MKIEEAIKIMEEGEKRILKAPEVVNYYLAHKMAIKYLEAWEKIIHEIEICGGMNGYIEKGEAIGIIKQYLGEVEE